MKICCYAILIIGSLGAVLATSCAADPASPVQDAKTIASLMEGLRSSQPAERQQAAKTLVDMGPAAKAAVPALRNLSLHFATDRRVRAEVVQVLLKIDSAEAHTLIRDLVFMSPLRCQPYSEGTEALALIRPDIQPYLGDLLLDSKTRTAAVYLVGSEASRFAIAFLGKLLTQPTAANRVLAAEVFGQLGAAAKEAVPMLHRALQDESPLVRVHAAAALWAIEQQTTATIPVLVKELQQGELTVRRLAAQNLARMGPKARPAQAELIEALQEKDADIGWSAFQTIAAIGPGAVPALIQAWAGSNAAGQDNLMQLLDRHGAAANAAEPLLRQLLQDKGSPFRLNAALLLRKITPAAHVQTLPVLIELLQEKSCPRCNDVLRELIQIGAPAKKAVPVLLEKLTEKNRNVLVAHTLLQLDRQTHRQVVPALMETLKEIIRTTGCKSLSDRILCSDTLAAIGPEARAALPVLREYLNETLQRYPRSNLETEAIVKALIKIGLTPDMAPQLIQILRHQYNPASVAAAQALGEIGKAAPEAVPALREALNSTNPRVRAVAEEALKKIEAAQP